MCGDGSASGGGDRRSVTGPASGRRDRRAVTGQRAVGRTGGRWRGSDALWTGTSPENTPGMPRVGRQGETSRCGVAPRRAAIASTGAVPADVPIYGFVCWLSASGCRCSGLRQTQHPRAPPCTAAGRDDPAPLRAATRRDDPAPPRTAAYRVRPAPLHTATRRVKPAPLCPAAALQGRGSSSTWVTSSATLDRSERCSVTWAKRSFSLSASTTEAMPS